MKLDPYDFAAGWLSVRAAASTDKDRPQLCKTVYVEQFSTGVRLVATDSYMLLTTWVPAEGHQMDAEPDLDEAPMVSAVVIDNDGRGKSILAHLLVLGKRSLHEDYNGPEPMVSLDLGQTFVDDETEPTLVGMQARYAVIEIPDHERVKLSLYDGEYPNWRPIVAGFTPDSTGTIALNPDILKRLVKVAGYHGGTATIGWMFGGSEKMAQVRINESGPHIHGAVMPCRWDMNTNQPAEEDEPKTTNSEETDDYQYSDDDDDSLLTVHVRGDDVVVDATDRFVPQ